MFINSFFMNFCTNFGFCSLLPKPYLTKPDHPLDVGINECCPVNPLDRSESAPLPGPWAYLSNGLSSSRLTILETKRKTNTERPLCDVWGKIRKMGVKSAHLWHANRTRADASIQINTSRGSHEVERRDEFVWLGDQGGKNTRRRVKLIEPNWDESFNLPLSRARCIRLTVLCRELNSQEANPIATGRSAPTVGGWGSVWVCHPCGYDGVCRWV